MGRENKENIVLLTATMFILFSLISIFYTLFNSISSDITLNFFFYSIGRLAGLIGFLFLSLLIFSGETARFFDRYFGMDKIIKFQRKFAIVTAIFILFHPTFFILSDRIYLSYLIPNFTIIPLALGTLSLYIFIIVMVSSRFYKRISYRVWQYIHILTYSLFFFSLYHAINIGSDYNNLSIKLIFNVLLISVVIGIIYRTNYKLKQRKNKFYVKDIKWETEDTFTLVIEPQQPFSFKPGQFCFLRLDKDKLHARHPFTISSSPYSKDLHFTIKLAGRFTKISSRLKRGEEIVVEGPFGIFTIENKKKDLVFIAGGVGITPFMSMIKSQVKRGGKQHITLIYGSTRENDIIFRDELDKIMADWFKKIYVLSNESSEKYETGYISKEMIQKYVGDISDSVFFLCGPETMKNKIKKALSELGVSGKNIIIESFFW